MRDAFGSVKDFLPARVLKQVVVHIALHVGIGLLAVLGIAGLVSEPISPRTDFEIVRGFDGVELDETERLGHFRGLIGHSSGGGIYTEEEMAKMGERQFLFLFRYCHGYLLGGHWNWVDR